MNKLTHLIFAIVLISLNFFHAQERKDRRTDPDLYFLEISEVPNSLDILPPPPDEDSVLFEIDKEMYEWGKLQRNKPRGLQAYDDANINGEGINRAFSGVFGFEISKRNTPQIDKLIKNMREDAGDLATRHAKSYYKRTRPFMLFGEDTCNPDQQRELSNNGSYPSGHAAIGWATALVLAEINPEHEDKILKRGLEIGESRVICGYHFQSDIEAGRIVAGAVVSRLHTNPAFMAQLKKAKKEIQKLKKEARKEFAKYKRKAKKKKEE